MKCFIAALIAVSAQALFGKKMNEFSNKQMSNGLFSSLDIMVDGARKTLYVASDNK